MENMFSERTVVMGIAGGIAAYKAAELARLLKKAGADVHCIMTEAAREATGTECCLWEAKALVAHVADLSPLTYPPRMRLQQVSDVIGGPGVRRSGTGQARGARGRAVRHSEDERVKPPRYCRRQLAVISGP